MLDAYEMQKREKQRLKELKKKGKYENKNGIDEITIKFIYTIGGLFMFGLILAIVTMISINKTHEQELNECEQIGGKYIVIDRHAGYKGVVEEYGCVRQ